MFATCLGFFISILGVLLILLLISGMRKVICALASRVTNATRHRTSWGQSKWPIIMFDLDKSFVHPLLYA